MTRPLLMAIVPCILLLAQPAWGQNPNPEKPKKDSAPQTPSKLLYEVVEGMSAMMREPNAVKNLAPFDRLLGSVVGELKRQATEKSEGVPQMLKTYLELVQQVGVRQFRQAMYLTARSRRHKKAARQAGLSLYERFLVIEPWLTGYHDNGAEDELKPELKQAIRVTRQLNELLVKWLLTLPGVNKSLLLGMAKRARTQMNGLLNRVPGAGNAMREGLNKLGNLLGR